MHDSQSISRRAFKVDSDNLTEWFDVRGLSIGSVQSKCTTTGGMTATLELLYANEDCGNDGTLFSPTKEITADGTTPTIDFMGVGFGFLGVRVKTAGASGERVTLKVFGRSDNGNGSHQDKENPLK